CAINVFRAQPFCDQLSELLETAPIDAVEWFVGGPGDRALPHWSALVNDPVFARIRRLKPALAELSARDLAELHDSPYFRLDELNLLTCEPVVGQVAQVLHSPRFRLLRKLGLHVRNEDATVVPAAADFTDHRLAALKLYWLEVLGAASSGLWKSGILSTPLFAGLKELDLSTHPISPADARELARSPAVGGLESLRLRGCSGGDTLATELAGSEGLVNLRRLDLRENNIGPDGARALAESPYLANLRVLDLCDNTVGDVGATALARSPHLAQLLDLNLLFGGVGDPGARAILDSPLPSTLVRLELHMLTMRMVKGTSPITEPVARMLRECFGDRLVLDAVSPPLAPLEPPYTP
ncbi:MAG: hypothetical protein K2V38_21585, partial [Gemmataceae bacterium]|nr:hypothetical protein [Gemmataceae bacterium]